jgi:cobalamin biosynthesis protein CobD/CbiB
MKQFQQRVGRVHLCSQLQASKQTAAGAARAAMHPVQCCVVAINLLLSYMPHAVAKCAKLIAGPSVCCWLSLLQVQLICSLAIILLVRNNLSRISLGQGGLPVYVCYAAVPGQASTCE